MLPSEAVMCYPSSLSLAKLSSLQKPGTSKSRHSFFLKQNTEPGSQSRIQSTVSSHTKASNYLREHCNDSFPRRAFSQAIHGITPEKVPFVKLCLFSFSLSLASLFFVFIPNSRGRNIGKKGTLEKKIKCFNIKNTETFPFKSKIFQNMVYPVLEDL